MEKRAQGPDGRVHQEGEREGRAADAAAGAASPTGDPESALAEEMERARDSARQLQRLLGERDLRRGEGRGGARGGQPGSRHGAPGREREARRPGKRPARRARARTSAREAVAKRARWRRRSPTICAKLLPRAAEMMTPRGSRAGARRRPSGRARSASAPTTSRARRAQAPGQDAGDGEGRGASCKGAAARMRQAQENLRRERIQAGRGRRARRRRSAGQAARFACRSARWAAAKPAARTGAHPRRRRIERAARLAPGAAGRDEGEGARALPRRGPPLLRGAGAMSARSALALSTARSGACGCRRLALAMPRAGAGVGGGGVALARDRRRLLGQRRPPRAAGPRSSGRPTWASRRNAAWTSGASAKGDAAWPRWPRRRPAPGGRVPGGLRSVPRGDYDGRGHSSERGGRAAPRAQSRREGAGRRWPRGARRRQGPQGRALRPRRHPLPGRGRGAGALRARGAGGGLRGAARRPGLRRRDADPRRVLSQPVRSGGRVVAVAGGGRAHRHHRAVQVGAPDGDHAARAGLRLSLAGQHQPRAGALRGVDADRATARRCGCRKGWPSSSSAAGASRRAAAWRRRWSTCWRRRCAPAS